MLADKIVKHLSATVFPQSVAELVRALPGSAAGDIEQACDVLRANQQLDRNGADTTTSPYRFYMKRATD